ncbi:hypothetical protein [Nonomuraea sp. 10N515B]|uniref:hypothetical protein n=1 Tax=Nonomuraea sp. 10N515B TaxID=3457422 RepID=UPI003FCC33D1
MNNEIFWTTVTGFLIAMCAMVGARVIRRWKPLAHLLFFLASVGVLAIILMWFLVWPSGGDGPASAAGKGGGPTMEVAEPEMWITEPVHDSPTHAQPCLVVRGEFDQVSADQQLFVTVRKSTETTFRAYPAQNIGANEFHRTVPLNGGVGDLFDIAAVVGPARVDPMPTGDSDDGAVWASKGMPGGYEVSDRVNVVRGSGSQCPVEQTQQQQQQ